MSVDNRLTRVAVRTLTPASTSHRLTRVAVRSLTLASVPYKLTRLAVRVIDILGGTSPVTYLEGGIFFVNPEKTEKSDFYYSTAAEKIPDPTFRTAFTGN